MAEPNPVLVDVVRGALVESQHRGALAVVRPTGELVLELGDIRRPVYPRSAVKAFQAIPLIETGAADALGFGAAEIALACASHSGTERHVELATRMLDRAGLADNDLECGPQVPLGEAAAVDFHRGRQTARRAHNNCSGKHSGMLAACRHCNDPTRGYTALAHPHQQRILRVLQEFTGEALGPDVTGIDGCSAPNWAMPLASMAKAFAQLATGEGAARNRRAITERILAAGFAEPELIAGPGRFDTRFMTAVPGVAFIKTGAEGVYCGALPGLGLGFALKIDDGMGRAAEMATGALLAATIKGADSFGKPSTLKNLAGTDVGSIRPADALLHALDRVRLR